MCNVDYHSTLLSYAFDLQPLSENGRTIRRVGCKSTSFYAKDRQGEGLVPTCAYIGAGTGDVSLCMH